MPFPLFLDLFPTNQQLGVLIKSYKQKCKHLMFFLMLYLTYNG